MSIQEPSTTDVVYDYIRTFIQDNGYPPSLREISAGCFIGRSTAVRYLDKLEAQGRISRDEGRARSIRLLYPE